MDPTPNTAVAPILLTFGGLFLLGLLADLAGRHTPLPRVTLLMLAGFVIGPSALDWLPAFTDDWFPVLTDVALAMIGFLLGQNFSRKKLKELGPIVMGISTILVATTVLLVFCVLVAFGVSPEIALLLAGIATPPHRPPAWMLYTNTVPTAALPTPCWV